MIASRNRIVAKLVGVFLLASHGALALPIPDHIRDTGHESDPLIQSGYLDVTLYDGWNGNPVDPGGVLDSTAALNKALRDGRDYNLTVYMPSGTYLVSDTLLGEQHHQQWGCATHVDNGTGHKARQVPSLVGSFSGPRPVIRLADSIPGFQDPEHLKAVVYFINSGNPDNPGWEGDADCGMGWIIRGIEVRVGGGNPGAVGIQMASAQYCTLEDVRVDATGGYAGVRGVPTTNVVVNLEVIGGRYGVIPYTCCGVSMVGVVLRGQEEAALLIDTWGTVVVTGFEIEKAQGPAVMIRNWGQTSQLTLLDGSIVIGSGNGPAIDNDDPESNAAGKDLYLRNIYIDTPGSLVKSGDNSVVPSGGGWNLVREYSYTNTTPHNTDAGPVTSWTLIEGQRGQEELVDVYTEPAPPPSDLLSRHVWTSIPSFEDPGVFNVLDAGIVGDGVTDVTQALQDVIDQHDVVFLPRGDYIISGTLELRANTKLFGMPGTRTRIYAPNWFPAGFAPYIRTVDDPGATTYIGDLYISFPDTHEQTYLSAVEWRAGRRSWTRQIAMRAAWTASDFASHPRKWVHIQGSGGGRWYALTSMAPNESKTQHSDLRFLLVEGASEPLTFYGPNLEHGRCDTLAEFLNASNVRILGSKTETDSLLSITNSNNIMIAGITGHQGKQGVLSVDNCIDVLMADISLYANRYRVLNDVYMIQEQNMPNAGSLLLSENCSYYRRGTFDDDVFRFGEGDNLAPFVNAGPDQTVALADTVTLSGTVSDDGLPDPPGAVTVAWTRVSGPGDAAFGDPSVAATTVTLSEAGEYVLRLSADDGELSASDEVMVTVRDESATLEIPWTDTAPGIDGVMDSVWENGALCSVENLVDGMVSGPEDLAATFQVLWDDDNLYLLVEVTDDALVNDSDNPWNDDGVEVYIDANHDAGSAYGEDDYQFVFRLGDSSVHETKHDRTDGVAFTQSVGASGWYIMEIAFPWATLGQDPATNRNLGLEVAVNDDDDGGARDGMLAWWTHDNVAHNDPSTLAVARLVGGSEECDPPLTDCAGVCVDLDSDHENCGSCGNTCDDGHVCNQGKCELECSPGLTDCGGSCVDLNNSPFHCGECGNSCPSGHKCSRGKCGPDCGPGTREKDGICVPVNEGGCGCGWTWRTNPGQRAGREWSGWMLFTGLLILLGGLKRRF